MDPVIVRVEVPVEISAPPSAVFTFVSDAEAKARLNPFVQVIRIERETPGPLREGSVTYFRLQKGKRIFEYRTRCRQFEADRLLESQAELPTLFRVRVELEPIPGGTRLTQREECELTLEMLEGLPVSRRAERAWRTIKLINMVLPGLGREAYGIILLERAEALRTALRRELWTWLQAVKQHIEAGETGSAQRSAFSAQPRAER
ncbi:MAG TPA: SRPBCC family protein [Candidatus Acidoferrum sp.]|nr:SRPBCC family protein [Candidatus Acidoferrum sp.]